MRGYALRKSTEAFCCDARFPKRLGIEWHGVIHSELALPSERRSGILLLYAGIGAV